MRKLTTAFCCAALLAFGAIVGLNNKADPGMVAYAAPISFNTMPYDLQLSRMKPDTVYITKDSIKYVTKEHVKEVRVPYAVHDTLYVPVLYIATLRDRKQQPTDSIKDAKYTVKKVDSPDSVLCRNTIAIAERE